MTASVLARVCIAVIVCAAILVLTAFYEDLFLPEWQVHEFVETKTPSGDVAIGIAHVFRIPPTIEVVLRIAIPLFSLVGLAAYVARLAPDRKVWSGAIASMVAALMTLTVLQIVIARKLDLGHVPHATTVAVWVAVSLSIGAAASWIFAVWWPDKSLERTRER